jgi:hypothetical protein
MFPILRGTNLRQTIPAFLAAFAVCAGYSSAGPIAGLFVRKAQSQLPVFSFEEAKSDFISVAVFEGNKVRGYLSFRIAFSISDTDRVPEVGYLASDYAIRSKFSLADIRANLPGLSKKLEREIKSHVEGILPAELVNSVRIADFGFDARI